ncbi:MAG TPA: UDP-N-acetylmuramoyl-L-alanine--D-glutamate ligase, partial [Gammaproteobacteria bacterium]|nr:UDP-N-acetylmuramoyl-L-alanine--D-glutamate ligase [Gammaproteobacteria bacterium]
MANNLHVVVGLGVTGLSCLRYLVSKNIPVAGMDTRSAPPGFDAIQQEFPGVRFALGELDESLLIEASVLVVSPGISLREPAIAKQIAFGKPAVGDIELFAQATKMPIVAITGSNAKSTVTTLVG